MRKTMTVRQAGVERARGAEYFRGLSPLDKHELGDQLVLGDFDWRDWFRSKPSSAFMNGVDAARIHWEIMSDGSLGRCRCR